MRPLLARLSGEGAEEPLDIWEHLAMEEFVQRFRSPWELLREAAEDEEYEWYELYEARREAICGEEEAGDWAAIDEWTASEERLEDAGE
jgi:hypothetical protein